MAENSFVMPLVILGGILILSGTSSARRATVADAGDLITGDDTDIVNIDLDDVSLGAFSDALNESDGFAELVEVSNNIFGANRDQAARMVLISGLLDSLDIDKIAILADMYSRVMTGWLTSFADITSQFMITNASLYESYASDATNAVQCKKSSIHFKTDETNTQTNKESKTNVLLGILGSGSSSTSVDVKNLVRTPMPICSQWGIDEAAAVALYKGMNTSVKANYLAWLLTLNNMPTMLSALGV
jgi:hypothetical protein